jgi:hypothetical protein
MAPVQQAVGVLLVLLGWAIGSVGVAGIIGPAIALQGEERADD